MSLYNQPFILYRPTTMKSNICTLTMMLLVLFCAGCGQSGPLYVPGDPSSINVPPTAEASDETAEEDGKEEDSQ